MIALNFRSLSCTVSGFKAEGCEAGSTAESGTPCAHQAGRHVPIKLKTELTGGSFGKSKVSRSKNFENLQAKTKNLAARCFCSGPDFCLCRARTLWQRATSKP